jgi:hypothetical protein
MENNIMVIFKILKNEAELYRDVAKDENFIGLTALRRAEVKKKLLSSPFA